MKGSNQILVFSEYFYPAFKAGGAARSVYNLVEALKDDAIWNVFCRDRDIGDIRPFEGVRADTWMDYNGVNVFYSGSPLDGVRRGLLNRPSDVYDCIYFNSFFNLFYTILPLLLIKFGFLKTKLVILAPRGEFSKGALELKTFKKIPYILFFKFFFRKFNIIYQASSNLEVSDIESGLSPNKISYVVAPDLIGETGVNAKHRDRRRLYSDIDKSSALKLCFISRICRTKNLDFVIKVLKKVSVDVHINIYGPIEDFGYWNLCLKSISELPKHVSAKYCGTLEPYEIYPTFSAHDASVLPTLGENFGHVIVESLLAHTPVIISDRTMWCGNGENGIFSQGLCVDDWVACLNFCGSPEGRLFLASEVDCNKGVEKHVDMDRTVGLNRRLFGLADV